MNANNQVTRHMVLVTPAQATATPNQVIENVAFFDATGTAVDIMAIIADYESRIAALEGA